MTKRISCSMTVEAVKDRSKTVTRRHVDTWQTLKAGDRLTIVEKAMGLPKGAKQVVLAEVEIIDVRVEDLGAIQLEDDGTTVEGLPQLSWPLFVRFWCESHGYRDLSLYHAVEVQCRRIEWRYL